MMFSKSVTKLLILL